MTIYFSIARLLNDKIVRTRCAPVAQLDRASAFEAEGRGFEPLQARHISSAYFTANGNHVPFARQEFQKVGLLQNLKMKGSL